MDAKQFWKSKTLWVNVIVIVGIILNAFFGFELTAEEQGVIVPAILGIVNIALRVKTNTPLKK